MSGSVCGVAVRYQAGHHTVPRSIVPMRLDAGWRRAPDTLPHHEAHYYAAHEHTRARRIGSSTASGPAPRLAHLISRIRPSWSPSVPPFFLLPPSLLLSLPPQGLPLPSSLAQSTTNPLSHPPSSSGKCNQTILVEDTVYFRRVPAQQMRASPAALQPYTTVTQSRQCPHSVPSLAWQ